MHLIRARARDAAETPVYANVLRALRDLALQQRSACARAMEAEPKASWPRISGTVSAWRLVSQHSSRDASSVVRRGAICGEPNRCPSQSHRPLWRGRLQLVKEI